MSAWTGIGAMPAAAVASPAAAQSRETTGRPPMPDLATAARRAPLIVAHRGRLAPDEVENSLGQFRKTLKAGPFMLEMDLRESRDGRVFLLHDPTLDRTSNGRGPITVLDADRLGLVRLRAPAGRLVKETLPNFSAVLQWASDRGGAFLMLDLKDVDPADVVAMVRRAGLVHSVILLTFDQGLAARALAADREVLVSVLVRNNAEIADYRQLAGSRPLAFYVPQDGTPGLFKAAKAAGGLVVTDAVTLDPYSNLDAQAQAQGGEIYAQFLRDHPADILVTDHPREAGDSVARSH